MLTRLKRRHGLTPKRVGADKGYFVASFLDSLRRMRLRTLERVTEQPLLIAPVQNLKRLVTVRQLVQAG